MELPRVCFGDVFFGVFKGWKNRKIEFNEDSILIFKDSRLILCIRFDSIAQIEILPINAESKSEIWLKGSGRTHQFRFYLDKGYSIFISEVFPKVKASIPFERLPKTLSQEEIKTDHSIVSLFSKIKQVLEEREREMIASLDLNPRTRIAIPDISQMIQSLISLRAVSTSELEVKRISGNPYFQTHSQRTETVSFQVTHDVLLKGISVIVSNLTFIIDEMVIYQETSMDRKVVMRHSGIEVVHVSKEIVKRIDFQRPVVLKKNSKYSLVVQFPLNSLSLCARVEKGSYADGVVWEFKKPCSAHQVQEEKSNLKEGRVAFFHFIKLS